MMKFYDWAWSLFGVLNIVIGIALSASLVLLPIGISFVLVGVAALVLEGWIQFRRRRQEVAQFQGKQASATSLPDISDRLMGSNVFAHKEETEKREELERVFFEDPVTKELCDDLIVAVDSRFYSKSTYLQILNTSKMSPVNRDSFERQPVFRIPALTQYRKAVRVEEKIKALNLLRLDQLTYAFMTKPCIAILLKEKRPYAVICDVDSLKRLSEGIEVKCSRELDELRRLIEIEQQALPKVVSHKEAQNFFPERLVSAQAYEWPPLQLVEEYLVRDFREPTTEPDDTGALIEKWVSKEEAIEHLQGTFSLKYCHRRPRKEREISGFIKHEDSLYLSGAKEEVLRLND